MRNIYQAKVGGLYNFVNVYLCDCHLQMLNYQHQSKLQKCFNLPLCDKIATPQIEQVVALGGNLDMDVVLFCKKVKKETVSSSIHHL